MKRKPTERQAFESWCMRTSRANQFGRYPNKEYDTFYKEEMWQAWQASARRRRK